MFKYQSKHYYDEIMMSFTNSKSCYETLNKPFQFLTLPLEIQDQILLHCDYITLLQYSKTSKKIRKIIKNNHWFWKLKTKKDFGSQIPKILPTSRGWWFSYRRCRRNMSLKLIDSVKGSKYSEKSRAKSLEILQLDIDINASDEFGDTALIWACSVKDTKIVSELLRMKADPNIKGQHDKTALIEASRGGVTKPELIRLLLKYGSDPEAKDRTNTTPLKYAIQWGQLKTVQELLKVCSDSTEAHLCSIAWQKYRITHAILRHQGVECSG